jgi:hypothetical protein
MFVHLTLFPIAKSIECSKSNHTRPILFVGSVYCIGINLFRFFKVIDWFQILQILSLSLISFHWSELYVTNCESFCEWETRASHHHGIFMEREHRSRRSIGQGPLNWQGQWKLGSRDCRKLLMLTESTHDAYTRELLSNVISLIDCGECGYFSNALYLRHCEYHSIHQLFQKNCEIHHW